MNSLDEILHFSEIFDMQTNESGTLLVLFVFSLVWQLVDTTLDDEGLLELTPENNSRWPVKPQDMNLDVDNMHDEIRKEHRQSLQAINSIMVIELIGQFMQNKTTSRILYLARQNMSGL